MLYIYMLEQNNNFKYDNDNFIKFSSKINNYNSCVFIYFIYKY